MPDGKPAQDCVRLNLKKPLGRWDDIECGNQMVAGAICQVLAKRKQPRAPGRLSMPIRVKLRASRRLQQLELRPLASHQHQQRR